MNATAPARTPLHALHQELGARMVPFAGYELPLHYPQGQRAEHLWTREHAGLFDVSHMGQLRLRGLPQKRGSDLWAALEQALPVDFADWPDGQQRYSLLLNDGGGIDDDLMVARLGEEASVVANAACKARDATRLQALCPGIAVSLLGDALLALQGPRAPEVLPEAAHLRFMQVERMTLGGSACTVARSGYTGEDGFEISVPAGEAAALARRLLAHPAVKAAGLAARDTLRLEAALPLYGQELDAQTTPREAGLAWAIARSRRAGGAKAGGFPGADGAGRASRRLVGLLGEDPVPVRSGARIVDAAGADVGRVTSGTVSPSLCKPVMLAYLSDGTGEASPLFAVVRDRSHPVLRAPLPFVPKRYRR